MEEQEHIVVNKVDEALHLPPGFRFHPSDEEIITCYLINKVLNSSFSAIAIGEADFNKSEPWDLPKKAKMGEKDWYFFCQRDRKYPTGMRTNRATQTGYWKATGKDREIFKGKTKQLVGMKKTLVFYKGRAPKGEKTNWVMHEFRLEGKFASYNLPNAAKDEWVVSRIFHKNNTIELKKNPSSISTLLRINSIEDDLLDFSSLPPLVDPFDYYSNNITSTSNNVPMERITFSQAQTNDQIQNPSLFLDYNNIVGLDSVSQDTCLTNDINTTDNSSIASMGRNQTLYEDLEGPSSIDPLSNFDCLWEWDIN